MKKLLVMGIGNMLLTDDGVGVFAAQALQKEVFPENVTVIEAGTFTHDIFYMFEGYDTLLVLDIVHGQSEPGSIYLLAEGDLRDNEKQRLSIHDIDLLDSLRMAELLHGSIPSLKVVGIEPYDYTSWNIGISEIVQSKFEDYLEIVRKQIDIILKDFEK